MSSADSGNSSSVPMESSYDGFAYPNGTCMFLNQTPSDDADPAAVIQERFLLRIPMWIFSAISLYITIMVIIIARQRSKSAEVEDRNVVMLRYGLLVASCVTTIVLFYFSFAIYVELLHSIGCSAWYKLENALYWTNISIIYTVLWLRQRVVYSQRTLREVVSKVTSFFSSAVAVLVVILPVSNAVIFSVSMTFCFDELIRLCRLEVGEEWAYSIVVLVSELTVPIIIPLILLGLFAWPLIRYHMKSRHSEFGQKSMVGMLWRISIATAAALAADIVHWVLLCTSSNCPSYISPTLRHFSLFCNLLCLVVSFAEWKKILFLRPPKSWRFCFKSPPSSVSSSSSK